MLLPGATCNMNKKQDLGRKSALVAFQAALSRSVDEFLLFIQGQNDALW